MKEERGGYGMVKHEAASSSALLLAAIYNCSSARVPNRSIQTNDENSLVSVSGVL